MATMQNVCTLLSNWSTTGTNSKQDPAFRNFQRVFKSALLAELKKVNAVNVVFSYGHYYISGFFTVNNQPYYFSLSDVRATFPVMGLRYPLMYRTADNYKDYRGGSNRWVEMETDMFIGKF